MGKCTGNRQAWESDLQLAGICKVNVLITVSSSCHVTMVVKVGEGVCEPKVPAYHRVVVHPGSLWMALNAGSWALRTDGH